MIGRIALIYTFSFLPTYYIYIHIHASIGIHVTRARRECRKSISLYREIIIFNIDKRRLRFRQTSGLRALLYKRMGLVSDIHIELNADKYYVRFR